MTSNSVSQIDSEPAKWRLTRGAIEVIADILKTCENPTPKTHVLYKANLSYSMLARYLDLLINDGLVEEKKMKGRPVFRTTDAGREYLLCYLRIMQLARSLRA